MRIFNSLAGDPMLLDTEQGLRIFQKSFDDFLASPSLTASFLAATDGNPEPYEEFLLGFRISKEGKKQLLITPDRWLEFSGPPQYLQEFCKRLAPIDGEHNHWYDNPVSLIIEADNSWPGHDG